MYSIFSSFLLEENSTDRDHQRTDLTPKVEWLCMATLNYTERRRLEEFLGMGSGYVLDFSNRTFREFIHDSVGMDIDDQNVGGSGSKAWRLRHFWSEQPDYVVGKLLKDMIE